MDEWIKKMWYTDKLEYYSAIKKKEILAFATAWMDLEGIMVTEISQTKKDKYCIISLGWSLNKHTSKLMDTNRLVIPRQGLGVGKMGEGSQKAIFQL